MNDQRNFGQIVGAQSAQSYGAERAYEAQQQASGAGVAAELQCRQSAKSVIRNRVLRLRDEANQLEALLRALPEELPPQADQALYSLSIAARRG